MLTYDIEFVEQSEYAYAVARIRALERSLISLSDYTSLATVSVERIPALVGEMTGIKVDHVSVVTDIIERIEESFTHELYLVKSLLLEDEIKRLVSLKYDYELLKILLKKESLTDYEVPSVVSRRSNYSYPVLKSLLEGGHELDTGSRMYAAYFTLKNSRETNGQFIDHECDVAYYNEIFDILADFDNPFLRDYFVREIDACNIVICLRLKLQDAKRSLLRERILPHGSIDLSFLEQGFDLNLESFASRIIFSPLAQVIKNTIKSGDEEEQVSQLERLLDEDLMRYLKESIFVTFGVEPVVAYLWMKEMQVKNLRIILLSKHAGVPAEEIKKHVRGFYG
jgi:V/A-type H+-transporting ATPase subunit C